MTQDQTIAILSFYSFTKIDQLDILLQKTLLIGKKKLIRGTILIATEGFNGSISGGLKDLELLVNEIKKLTNAQDINVKVNYAPKHPFQKLRVKIKKEIISMGIGDIDTNTLKGEYVDAKHWDDFLNQQDVVLIDTRNDYEILSGTFVNAVNPNTKTFKQFPKWALDNEDILQGKKIAMYCTGGIRCEKSTAYLKQIGFKDVYHLKGGILQYLEDTKNQNNLWQGECFVFDDRVEVTNELSPAENSWLERRQ